MCIRTDSNQSSLLSNYCYFMEFSTCMVDFVPPPPVIIQVMPMIKSMVTPLNHNILSHNSVM